MCLTGVVPGGQTIHSLRPSGKATSGRKADRLNVQKSFCLSSCEQDHNSVEAADLTEAFAIYSLLDQLCCHRTFE